MDIKIYTTQTCPFCKAEKEYLDSKKIKYENIPVDLDSKSAEVLIKESGQIGVPFTVITKDNGQIFKILGFDQEKLDQALDIT